MTRPGRARNRFEQAQLRGAIAYRFRHARSRQQRLLKRTERRRSARGALYSPLVIRPQVVGLWNG